MFRKLAILVTALLVVAGLTQAVVLAAASKPKLPTAASALRAGNCSDLAAGATHNCVLATEPSPLLKAEVNPLATYFAWGMDFAFNSQTPASAKSVGATFAVSYLSYAPSKNWTKANWDAFHAAGLRTVLNWEWGASDTAAGCAVGRAQATQANAEADALGAPKSAPIYYSSDFNGSWGQVSAYYACAKAPGWRPVGIYGGYAIAHGAALAGYHYIWQTYAWSNGAWEPKDTLQQWLNGSTWDHDRATARDYGQVPRPSAPPPPPTGPQGLEHFNGTFDYKTGHWTVARVPKAGSLTYTQHAKTALSQLTIQMSNGAISVKAGK